ADPEMSVVVRSGSVIARVELGHSVHVEVDGLEPERSYFYRFRVGDADSQVGRARTLPLPGAEVAQLRFASAGCQAWEGGYSPAWRRLGEDALHLVYHYAHYIYDTRAYLPDRDTRPVARALPKEFPTCIPLTDSRRRYAIYKTDPDLQAAHAACAFLPS